MRISVVSLLFAGLLAGCQTAAGPSLYTLDMTPSAQAGSPVNIEITRLRVAESLQNKRILIKTSPTEIDYYRAAQWAASLDELLAEKLAAEFGPSDPARETLVLSGTLLAFEQVDTATGGEAHVRLALELRETGTSHYSTPALAKTYDLRVPAETATAPGVVLALSESLEKIAREIVADAAAL